MPDRFIRTAKCVHCDGHTEQYALGRSCPTWKCQGRKKRQAVQMFAPGERIPRLSSTHKEG